MDPLQGHYYPESRFGGFTRIDGTIAFYLRVQALAVNARTVLDVGCGRGAHRDDPIALRRKLRDLRAADRCVIGIDVDAEAETNPYVDEFRPISADGWPIEDSSVDLCVADCVLEHLVKPDSFFAEAHRVLRKGGFLCVRTTNSWSYVALASRVVPNALHAKVLKKVQHRRQERDVFPTVYRCNTVPRIRKTLRAHRFDGVVLGHGAEPSYSAFSGFAYLLGVMYQRWAPSLFAPTLFVFAAAV